MCYFHVPARHVAKAYRRIRAVKGSVPHPLSLSTYGVEQGHLAAMDQQGMEEVFVHAASIATPKSTAQSIVLNHPELGSTDPLTTQMVITQYLQYSQSFSELVQYIQQHPPGSNGWYNKNWVMWAQNDDGTVALLGADGKLGADVTPAGYRPVAPRPRRISTARSGVG